jgi:heat-inducible transcriptional repressor
MLSGLAGGGARLAPKSEGAVRHIEFVPLGLGPALVVLANSDGHVKPRDRHAARAAPSALQQAGNYLMPGCLAARWPSFVGS